MSRITDMSLQPNIVYTKQGFLVRVKVQDDYFYKKYLISENLHYKTVQGTSFTITDADATKQAEITEIRGKGEKRKLPSEYQEVEYIEATGTQYILPNITAQTTDNLKMETEIQWNDITTRQLNGGNNIWYFGVRSGKYENMGVLTTFIPSTTSFDKVIFERNNNTSIATLTINDQVHTHEGGTVRAENITIFCLGRPISFYLNAKMKTYKIYLNNELVRNLIPCYRKSDNVIGMYDTVGGVFYTNTGTGTFGKGADIIYENVTGDNNIVVSNKNKLALNKVEKGRIDNGNVGYQNNTTNLEVTNTDITFTTNANYRGVVSDFMPIEIMQTINNYVYLLMDNKKAFLTNGAIQISFYDENKNYISSNSGYALNDTTQRYIITNNMKYARIWFCLNQQGTITLEKVSFGYYTEYTEHQGNSYKVDLKGKNLFNDILRQGVTIYNTGVWGASNSRITSTDWIKNVKAGTYTISAKTSTTKTLQVSMITFNTNGVFNNVSGVSGQWRTMPFTFTIPIDMNLKCNISYTNNSNITPSEVTEVQLEEGNQATEYSPSNPIELSENDKLWNNNGTWQLNDTEIIDTGLLEQLQALENIELYEDLCYVDFVENVKADMSLQYAGTEDLGTKFIITNDGKRIRTEWRRIGEEYGR